MNVAAPTQSLNWKKFLLIAIVLAIAGYRWYTENVQNERANQDVATQSETTNQRRLANDLKVDSEPYHARLPDNVKTDQKQSSPKVAQAANNENISTKKTSTASRSISKKPFLVSTGDKNLRSPAGLIYGMGRGGEHRVEHVMDHATDEPNRPAHGVFDGDQDTILRTIDEAYEMVKSKSKYVKSESSQGNMAHTISMGRKIGYEGGQKGKRSGFRPLNSIRLILDDNRVITAYPYR